VKVLLSALGGAHIINHNLMKKRIVTGTDADADTDTDTDTDTGTGTGTGTGTKA
jgi:hypothetical protein